jgi:hypothetical protein
MAGLSIPDGLAGSSLLPLINGVGDPNRKDFITAQVPHAITLSRYRYCLLVCAQTPAFLLTQDLFVLLRLLVMRRVCAVSLGLQCDRRVYDQAGQGQADAVREKPVWRAVAAAAL